MSPNKEKEVPGEATVEGTPPPRRASFLPEPRRMSLMRVEELEKDRSFELDYLKDAFAKEQIGTSGRSRLGTGSHRTSFNHQFGRQLDMSVSRQSADSYGGEEDVSVQHTCSVAGDDVPTGTEFGGKETQAVRALKIILVIILLLSAVAVATFIFLYTSRDEKDEFNQSFLDFAHLLMDGIQDSAQNRLEAIASLASQIQTYSITSNSTWPFVTVPFFEEQVETMKTLTAAYGVLLFPVVLDSQRQDWEEYSIEKKGWINASFEAQRIIHGEADQPFPENDETWFDVLWGDDYVNPNNPDFSPGIGSKIFRTSDPNDPDFHDPVIQETTSVYFPQWQVAPMSWYYQTTVNSNYGQWDDFYNSTVISIRTGTAVMGIAWTDGNAPGRITTMLYPVFNQFHGNDKKVVAFLGADIFWQDYLKKILPENANGIYVVIENTIGQVFTYELFGEEVEYVGYEDLHEPEYDHMVQTLLFGEHLHPPLPEDASYTGAPLHGGFIQYTMKIYPSKQLEDLYISNKPITYTILACLIFLFTSLIFIFYDCLVERRQKLVLATAIQSDAIVSSLFPNTVKDRLYNKNDNSNTQNAARNDSPEENKEHRDVIAEYEVPMKATLNNGDGATKRQSSTVLDKEPPIAEFYETSTILFADIVGFTQWSSDRPPADVFTLLETLYGRFDKLAKRRGVFKVETIGDCYVAVTGVPERRFDHAINMTKFARDMLTTLQEELKNLEPVLGSDTLNLAMRVGLHSGPVTAGVLRGERARFQLFGDSVNTAARMESNSTRNAIHVSEATATLIESAGKGSWLVKRKEKIVAKGKGEMQTFWVRAAPSRAISSAIL